MNNNSTQVEFEPEEGKTLSQIFSDFNQKNNFRVVKENDLIITYSNKTTLNLEINVVQDLTKNFARIDRLIKVI